MRMSCQAVNRFGSIKCTYRSHSRGRLIPYHTNLTLNFNAYHLTSPSSLCHVCSVRHRIRHHFSAFKGFCTKKQRELSLRQFVERDGMQKRGHAATTMNRRRSMQKRKSIKSDWLFARVVSDLPCSLAAGTCEMMMSYMSLEVQGKRRLGWPVCRDGRWLARQILHMHLHLHLLPPFCCHQVPL